MTSGRGIRTWRRWGWCRGKVTADVLMGGLNAGPLLRGGFEERVGEVTRHKSLPRFGPFDEVKTYSCFDLLDVEFSITRVRNRYLCLERI